MQRRRDVRIERLLVPLPLSLRICAKLGHAPAAPAIGRAPGKRAVNAPQARSGLTPPALFGTFAAGWRHSFPSAERGQPLRVPAYPSSRIIREAQGAAELPAPDRIRSGGSSLRGTSISCDVASLLRHRQRSGGAPLLRIIVRPRRSTRTTRPTS
ncbi:hypothetical protein NDU88_009503 [Pleurodeles waltl]|uniref:Uncharacterized protein n=1 Tax=Pleurodeles waltl TaxID=8319 RepID=A0AAV7QUT1_PLEWA|nr:hypothetical protein NDU88_009503 [Pleurodeles waltl]